MSNKDDNTIHLNDSQSNEDLELLDGIKTLANAEDVIDNQSKRKRCYVYTITVRN